MNEYSLTVCGKEIIIEEHVDCFFSVYLGTTAFIAIAEMIKEGSDFQAFITGFTGAVFSALVVTPLNQYLEKSRENRHLRDDENTNFKILKNVLRERVFFKCALTTLLLIPANVIGNKLTSKNDSNNYADITLITAALLATLTVIGGLVFAKKKCFPPQRRRVFATTSDRELDYAVPRQFEEVEAQQIHVSITQNRSTLHHAPLNRTEAVIPFDELDDIEESSYSHISDSSVSSSITYA